MLGAVGLVFGVRQRPRRATRRRLPAWLFPAVLVLGAALAWPAEAAAQAGQAVEYYHTDALGSVRAVTKVLNGQVQVVETHDYMPFGEEVSPPNPPKGTRLFTAKERDFETGWDYFGARYYRADNGRFTAVDPGLHIKEALLLPQRWNGYAYAWNNPLRFTDPDGRWGQDVHQRLTELLALAAGYSQSVAAAVAAADWNTDIRFSAFDGEENRRDWHFTDDARRGELRSAFDRDPSAEGLGGYLHAEQDSFSHHGYGWKTGHWTTSPDKTQNEPGGRFRADDCAQRTYRILVGARDSIGQRGTIVPLDGKLMSLVREWNRADDKAKPNIEKRIRKYVDSVAQDNR